MVITSHSIHMNVNYNNEGFEDVKVNIRKNPDYYVVEIGGIFDEATFYLTPLQYQQLKAQLHNAEV